MIDIFIDELQKLGDIQKMFEKLRAKGGDIAALGKKIKDDAAEVSDDSYSREDVMQIEAFLRGFERGLEKEAGVFDRLKAAVTGEPRWKGPKEYKSGAEKYLSDPKNIAKARVVKGIFDPRPKPVTAFKLPPT